VNNKAVSDYSDRQFTVSEIHISFIQFIVFLFIYWGGTPAFCRPHKSFVIGTARRG
jgi:hypothetical protein